MCIIGMTLRYMGTTVSLKDIDLQRQHMFVASDIIPWFNQLDRK